MDRHHADAEELTGVEGVDDAALGLEPPPESAPPGAEFDATYREMPGPHFDDRPPVEAKPWFTSLAADSDQAGVMNEPARRGDEAND